MEDKELLSAVIKAGLDILSHRALTLIALLLDAVMFGWAMQQGTWSCGAIAGLFAVATWTLVKVSPYGEATGR